MTPLHYVQYKNPPIKNFVGHFILLHCFTFGSCTFCMTLIARIVIGLDTRLSEDKFHVGVHTNLRSGLTGWRIGSCGEQRGGAGDNANVKESDQGRSSNALSSNATSGNATLSNFTLASHQGRRFERLEL